MLSAIPAVMAVKKSGLIVAGVAFLGLLAALGIQTLRLGWKTDDLNRAEQTIVAQSLALDDAASANESNQKTIRDLLQANEEWARLHDETELRVAAAEAASAAARRRVEEMRDRAARERSRDVATPACKELLDRDLGAVCPDLARRLFERSEKLRTH